MRPSAAWSAARGSCAGPRGAEPSGRGCRAVVRAAWPPAKSRAGARCPLRRRPWPLRRRRLRRRPVPSCSLLQGTCGLASETVSTLKERLRADLTTAMKARDELVKSTLRMTLTAVHNVEVAGTEARELDDAEVLQVITKEAKKRAESAEAFAAAGRDELAAQERAEGEVLARYLPQQLDDDELAALARDAVVAVEAETGQSPGPRQMGQVMKKAQAAAAGRADGKRVSAAVKALLVAPQ